jgi:phosphoribosylformylglycinamidine synthase subunit PurS
MLIARFSSGWREAKVLQWKAKVEVTLKKSVLDPQGVAVENSLKALGYEHVSQVRVGKYLELTLNAADRNEAADLVEEMSRRLLSNPVIEDFSYSLLEAG